MLGLGIQTGGCSIESGHTDREVGSGTVGYSTGPRHTDTGGWQWADVVLSSISLGLLLRNHNILFILGNLEPCDTSLRLQDGDKGHEEELTAQGTAGSRVGGQVACTALMEEKVHCRAQPWDWIFFRRWI